MKAISLLIILIILFSLVPVIKVEDDIIIGFNEERLSEFFGTD